MEPSPLEAVCYIVSLAMTDDERSMDTGTAPPTGSFSHLEDYEQWFPSLTFDGYRVKKTRPTDYIETTVMQPVVSASTGASLTTAGSHSSRAHVDDRAPESPDHPAEVEAPSPHGGDTLWLQMGRRSSIRTADGSVTPLAPRVDSRQASDGAGQTEREHESKRKYDHTVRRRKQALTLMALASSIVTVASLAALAATIVP